jgi:hypothetical protein
MDKHFIVYLPDEKVYGEVISYGSYASTVRYTDGGIEYEVVVLNEDLDFMFSIEEEE